MADSIENLMVRNLREVFGEPDSTRRAAAIETLFEPECIFSDPRGQHLGHRGLESAVVSLQAQFPDYAFSQIGSVDALQNSGRLAWHSGRRTNRGESQDWMSQSCTWAGSWHFTPSSTNRGDPS